MLIHTSWLLVLLGFATFCQADAKIEVTFAYEDATQFPYYIGDTSEVLPEKPGAAVELLKLLETLIPNLKVTFSRCHWMQCLNQLKLGDVDGVFNASFSKDRLSQGHYPFKNNKVDRTRRITTISYYFYRLKGDHFNWNGKQVSGLQGFIGTPMAYSIEGDLKKMGIKIHSSPSILDNFNNLLNENVQAIALQGITGDYFLRHKSGLKNIEKVNPAIKTKAYYLMLSKQFKSKHPNLSEKIWNNIRTLRNNNLKELINRYH